MMTEKFERGCVPSCIDECPKNGINIKTCCNKLNVIDWLSDIKDPLQQNRYVEVRFKNTRKAIFENTAKIELTVGDVVTVESTSGHDVGIVSSIGHIAMLQMKKYKMNNKNIDIKKIYRKAKSHDIIKWKQAIELEKITMQKAREIADFFNLNMKIGDVEYQGDKTKATFYYISEERVDFRQLIKKMAEEFNIRIEMKQIGARQEAGRIGGIGNCGRELCCTTWLSDFSSVSTMAARYQELPINTQKLAGQCSKLKCCLNYELSAYLDTRKHFPKNASKIITAQGNAHHIKNDIFKRLMYYEIHIDGIPVIRSLDIEKVKEIIEMNNKGIYPENIFGNEKSGMRNISYNEELNVDNINRFANKSKNNRRNRRNKNNNSNNNSNTNNNG